MLAHFQLFPEIRHGARWHKILNSKAVKKCVLICSDMSCVMCERFMFQNSVCWIVLDWQFDAIWFVHDHGLAMFGIVWLIVRYVQTEHV